jgi:RHS repeat-associated protein
MARGFHPEAGGLRPSFAASGSPSVARVLLPSRAAQPLHLEDVATGASADVGLAEARDVAAQAADGYLVYPKAHASGATVLHRALPEGAEDFVSFEERPKVPAVAYQVVVGKGVSGLRLVAGALEMLDAAGAPRLRVAPPYVVGADGVRTDARLAVEGCAVDNNPAAPWGRAVKPPGAATCTVRVTWDGEAVVYPAVLDPRWTTTGNMTAARQDHAAILLSTGKVLVAGGRGGSGSTTGLATAELYDPSTSTWAATGSMTGGRWSATATQLGTTSSSTTSGKVLVAGGINGTSSVNTAQLYSASAGTWTAAANLNVARHLHTATLLSTGNVLVAGGMTNTSVIATGAIYNPSSGTGTWTAVATSMSSNRRSHTATLLASSNTSFNNRVLIAGGNSGGTTSLTTVQLFDPSTATWSTTTALPSAREGHTATALAAATGNVLVTGGVSGTGAPLATTLVFTIPTSGTSATWASAGSMTSGRSGHTATLLSTAVLANGQLLVAGGSNGTSALATAELWNGTTTWTATTALPAAVQGHTATRLASGAVLIAGGSGTTAVNVGRVYDPSFALACTANSQCGTGFCANGVCCDTACNGGCGACNLSGKVGTCSAVTSGTVCRASAGICDVAETCNGTVLTCPTDAFAPSTTSCRAAAGECDVADNCTGTSAACPADAMKTSGTVCTDDGNACTTDTCNGTSATCQHAAGNAGTVCRASAGTCDVAETCTGTSTACPADGFAPSTTSCRAAAGECDIAENCTGTSAACPADAMKANGTACTDDGNACTTDACNGSSATCQHAAGNAGTVCRASAGICDVAETCTGTSTACPADAFAPSTTSCRTAAGECDVAESCPGTSAACPADVMKANGTACTDDGNACTTDACNGSSATCQHTAGNAGVVCRAAANPCDLAEVCTGSSTACPSDAKVADGTNCSDGNACTQTDTCQAGVCTGSNPKTCTASDQCHVAGTCNPATGACSNPIQPNGTSCDDGDPCSPADACHDGQCWGPLSNPICDGSPQVKVERQLGLIPGGYITPTFFDPVADPTVADITDPATSTSAWGINNAGAVAGFTQEQIGEYPSTAPGSAWVADGTGQHLLANPWSGQPAYAVDINLTGDIMGFGVSNGSYASVLYHPDRSFQILPVPVGVRLTRLNNVYGATGQPAMVGDTPTGSVKGGTLAVWHLDKDGGDAVGPSTLPVPPSSSPAWVAGHSFDPTNPSTTGDSALSFDGTACYSAAANSDTAIYSYDFHAGLTMMAWLNPDPTMCPGSGRRVIFSRGEEYELALACNADGSAGLTAALSISGVGAWTPLAGSVPLGRWSHVAVTWDHNRLRTFVNGAEAGAGQALPGAIIQPYLGTISVGCSPERGAAYNFLGAIDEVSAFRNGMGGDQINLFHRNKPNYPLQTVTNGALRYQDGFLEVILPASDPRYGGSQLFVAGTNDAGAVIGFRALAAGSQYSAVLFDPASGWRDLNDLIPPDSGWNLQYARAINNAGQIAGYGLHEGAKAAFRLDVNTGEIVDVMHLQSFWNNPAFYILADSVSASGHVAGAVYDDQAFWPQHAYVYTDEFGIIDLNSLIDPASGWVLKEATHINDNDEVVGWAHYGGGITANQGQWRAFKMKMPTLPPAATYECLGQADGASCSATATTCSQNNVCHTGSCGDDANAICLSLAGVADVGDGNFVAVFGYDSVAAGSIHPTTNQVLLDGAVVLAPQPPPPELLPPGPHVSAFLPTFKSGHSISWRVNGQMVTASSSSTPLTTEKEGASGLRVTIGGQKIIVKPDIAPYTAAPSDPVAGPVPDGISSTEFRGTLSGSLSVGPTGAAIYSVPISIPPGVAGMAPNLSLIYNSQAGDGLAGQGWELAGLSMITRCPRTRLLDGAARPVTMGPLAPGQNSDGLCLDGKRLLEAEESPTPLPISDTQYYMEQQDFSKITRSTDFRTFTIVTKTGETRYYASRPEANSRVSLGGQPVIWALDRVIDVWGNYYDLTYYGDDPHQNGIRVMHIDYTGHIPSGSTTPDVNTFYSVTFQYETRPDFRTVRFRDQTMIKSWRLTGITTNRGVYTLAYKASTPLTDPTNQSRLESIGYCALSDSTKCLKSLELGWSLEGGLAAHFWSSDDPNAGYALPSGTSPIGNGLKGTQFVDIDGDGLLDLIAQQVATIGGKALVETNYYHNNGHGWDAAVHPALPGPLVDSNYNPIGARFADINGDGLLDFIQDHANVTCVDSVCSVCQPNSQCGNVHSASPAVWLNNGAASNNWTYHSEFETRPTSGNWNGNFAFGGTDNDSVLDSLADVDNDGRMDVVRLTQGSGPSGPGVTLDILRSTQAGWQPIELTLLGPGSFNFPYVWHLEDVNRDGLPDLVVRTPYVFDDGTVQTYEASSINLGPTFDGSGNVTGVSFDGVTATAAVLGGTILPATQQLAYGDVDGDGFYDGILFYPTGTGSAYKAGVGLNDGVALGFSQAAPYVAALNVFAPRLVQSTDSIYMGDFGFALVDANGDGLVDLVRNHVNRTGGSGPDLNHGGGELLMNNGVGWLDPQQPPLQQGWQVPVPGTPVPLAVPGDQAQASSSAFVDLNGDGLPDLIQEPLADGTPSKAWLNEYTPPVIQDFPNAMANPTRVSYVVITTEQARRPPSPATPTYTVSSSVLPLGTRRLNAPLRVVQSVSEDTGTDNPEAITTYQYADLRTSSLGYGPQGFATMTVTDPSGMITTTTFAQTYPYTGLATSVFRDNLGPVSSTGTAYCTRNRDLVDGDHPCSDSPSNGAQTYPAGSSFFVRPVQIVDEGYSRTGFPEPFPGVVADTTTTYAYDDQGNSTEVDVKVTGLGEEYVKTTTNVYNAPGSLEERRGKVTDVTVKTTKTAGLPSREIDHHTTFQYRSFFGALALALSQVEPGSPEPGAELDTAYDYDKFGNVTTTTACASDFVDCTAGASGPTDLPFRTTTVSYSTGVLPVAVSYGVGRFPTSTTQVAEPIPGKPAGHVEYSIYDPLLGLVKQTIGPNGISTCYDYDALGNKTDEIARCGSTNPLVTTIQRFETTPPPPGPPCGLDVCPPTFKAEKVVTVTSPPKTSPTWVFSDALGRTLETFTYGFDGGLVESATEYDALGRVHRQSRPFRTTDPTYWTTNTYDQLGRTIDANQDLGIIDGTGTAAGAIADEQVTFQQLGSTTIETVNGQARNRRDWKNVLGKVTKILDANQYNDSTLGDTEYAYDVEGKLTQVTLPGGAMVEIGYDSRGRKSLTVDPDLGTWTYTYNGFGDLVTQKDAKLITTTMTYDMLGRMATQTRDDGSGTAQWIYDVAPGAGIGKLAAVVSAPDSHLKAPCTVPNATNTDGNRAGRWITYTALGDVQDVSECTDGDTFLTSYSYDPASGRTTSVTYPQVGDGRLSVGYHYSDLGYLHYVFDAGTNETYWVANSMNALGQVTDEYTRNGVETQSFPNPSTGWLLDRISTAHANGDTVLQNWGYRYDEAGNLLRRVRADQVTTAVSDEAFQYDLLDRVTSAHTVTTDGYNHTDSFSYDPLGNLTKVGRNYIYGGCSGNSGTALPHALCSLDGAPPFQYDLNGNMTSGGGRTITYNGLNKAMHIDGGGAQEASADFIYGADGNRVVQETTDSSSATARTVYVGMGGSGKSLYERTTRSTGVEHVQFIYAGGAHRGNAFALRIVAADGSAAATKYYHFDHLGSVTEMSDEAGRVVTETWGGSDATVLGYDAWGVRRTPEGHPGTASFPQQVGRREFTGQEAVPGVALVNMNGRMYDPALGRFLSPDPNVQFQADLQSYNRYSYVLNNPLRYADPTGYFSLSTALTVGAALFAPALLVDSYVAHHYRDPHFWIQAGEFALSAAVCASSAAGCLVIGVQIALLNAEIAVAQGAALGQTLALTGIGLTVGFATGGVAGNLGSSLGTAMVSGAVSSAATAEISAAVTHHSLGWTSLLEVAATGAASAAAGYAVQRAVALSRAQEGGGSGDRAVEQAAGRAAAASSDATTAAMSRQLGQASGEAGLTGSHLATPIMAMVPGTMVYPGQVAPQVTAPAFDPLLCASGSVQVCSQIADDSFLRSFGQHHWYLKLSDDYAVGIGQERSGAYGIRLEWGEENPTPELTTRCIGICANPDIVRNLTAPGTSVGGWFSPWNNCQTNVCSVLQAAGADPAKIPATGGPVYGGY